MTLEEVINHYRTNDIFCDLEFFAFDLNALLSNSEDLSPKQYEAVNLLDVGISTSPALVTTVFYRGCSKSDLDRFSEGETYTPPSFLSVSMLPFEAANFTRIQEYGDKVLLRVICPVGSRLLFISDPEAESLERSEYLLPREKRFRVSDWDGESGLDSLEILQLPFHIAPGTLFRTVEFQPREE